MVCEKIYGGVFLFCVDDEIRDDEWIFSSDRIGDFPNAYVVIMCSSPQKVIESMRRRGFENRTYIAPLLGYRFIIDAYMKPEQFYGCVQGWMKNHQDELATLYSLDDDYTRRLLNQRIRESLSFELVEERDYKDFVWMDYFSDASLSPKGDITFVDCGAYIGDTLQNMREIYKDRIKKYYLFEPNEHNFQLLSELVSDYGLEENASCFKGCYDYNGILKFTKVEDELEQSDNGEIEVPVVRLDDAIGEVKGTLCIKMDLEGSECAAIKGAAGLIKKYRPYMAICIYHKMEDILEVPKLIREISGGYNFYLRSGLHTEVYAVPDKK